MNVIISSILTFQIPTEARPPPSCEITMRGLFLMCCVQMASALLMGAAHVPRAIAPRTSTVEMMWHVFPRDGASGSECGARRT